MSKDAVVRQFFLDFIENLGDPVDEYQEHDSEECNQILTDMFFDGRLEIKWNVKSKNLMLKPIFVLNVKDQEGMIMRALQKTRAFEISRALVERDSFIHRRARARRGNQKHEYSYNLK